MNYNDISFFESNVDKIRFYNTCTDYIGYRYFRILKTFKSNNQSQWKGELFQNNERINYTTLLDKFPLRFYLPVDSLAMKCKENTLKDASGDTDDPRIKHLVIMINGLDEHEELFLKQYDFLGASFAENNIASVLLSTPFHLHRTVKYHVKSDKVNNIYKARIYKPSKVILDNWENMFHLYDTTFHDILELVKKIKNSDTADPLDSDYNFYKTHFSSETRISLLGYSLGGLFSLGVFLQYSDDLDKLILFNTPGNLMDASTRRIGIPQDTWEKIINELADTAPRTEALQDLGKDLNYITHFLNLMKGFPDATMNREIDDTKNRMLQIMCGGDNVIDLEPWSRYFDKKENNLTHKKISQHIFSGVGHNPILETRGSEIMPNISRIVIDHILNDENTSHWQENEIEDAIIKLLRGTETYEKLKQDLDNPAFHKTFKVEQLKKLLEDEFKDDDTRKKRFLKFYYLSKMYFPKFYDLIEKNKKKDERNRNK